MFPYLWGYFKTSDQFWIIWHWRVILETPLFAQLCMYSADRGHIICSVYWQPVLLQLWMVAQGAPVASRKDGWAGSVASLTNWHHSAHLQPVFDFGFNASGLPRFGISKLHHLILKWLLITNLFYKHCSYIWFCRNPQYLCFSFWEVIWKPKPIYYYFKCD